MICANNILHLVKFCIFGNRRLIGQNTTQASSRDVGGVKLLVQIVVVVDSDVNIDITKHK